MGGGGAGGLRQLLQVRAGSAVRRAGLAMVSPAVLLA